MKIGTSGVSAVMGNLTMGGWAPGMWRPPLRAAGLASSVYPDRRMNAKPKGQDFSGPQVDPMSDIFVRLSVLAEPTRARLLRILECEELGVGELANVVQLPQSTVSRHLKVLHNDGWLDRRKDGTASLFRIALDLPEGAGSLWPVVRGQAQALFADEDDHRLRAVIAARHVDSATWFGRMAEHWDGVRTELFGTDFTSATLLSLLPPHWTVLDLGCGTGAAVAELANVVRHVIGIDREQTMLEAAARRCAQLRQRHPAPGLPRCPAAGRCLRRRRPVHARPPPPGPRHLRARRGATGAATRWTPRAAGHGRARARRVPAVHGPPPPRLQ